MTITYLPTAKTLRQQFALSATSYHWIEESRKIVTRILAGKETRRLLIVGPCSIHDIVAARDYAIKLRQLAEEVKDSFYMVMRVYCEKPRSSLGWKGFLYDPDLNGTYDMVKGLQLTRQLLIDLAELRLPVAAELLDPMTTPYLCDLLSWGCIGARTSASPIHRQLASGMAFPIGFKNDINGNLSIAVHGALSASTSHHYSAIDITGDPVLLKTKGNVLSHLILRGGESGPNYDLGSITTATELLMKVGMPPRILIDCSHGNAPEHEWQQMQVFRQVISLLPEVPAIRGLLLESYLLSGHQQLQEGMEPQFGLSITDRCIDWNSTVELIQEAHMMMQAMDSNLCVASY